MTGASSSLLDQLTQLGDPNDGFDYLALGITADHVPELIRIATRRFPRYAPVADEVFWTRPHAWRALGQLRAEAAVEPLVRLLAEGDPEDDWILEDLPDALGMIGRAAIGPALEASLREAGDEYARCASVQAIGEVARRHPDARAEVVEVIVGILRTWETQSPAFNAFVVSELVLLGSVEAAPLMEAAFNAGAVELETTGSWESVQEDLGLIPRRPRKTFVPGPWDGDAAPRLGLRNDVVLGPPQPAKSRAKAKNRRNDAKAARKRNRRK